MKTYDGKRIIIPNSQIYTERVSVVSAYEMLRSEYDVGIGYGDDVAEAKEHDIVAKTEGILQEPAPFDGRCTFAEASGVRLMSKSPTGNATGL